MTKEKAIKATHVGCPHCGELHDVLPMDYRIAVGFGDASVLRNNEYVWHETPGMEYDDCLTVEQAERMAAADPEADWRIVIYGPLRGRVFQRHGAGQWCLIEENEGFA